MCLSLSTSKCSAHSHSSVRERTVSGKGKRNRKGKKRERVKAIVQVAGTDGSYQKMRLEWLAGLKVVTFIKRYKNTLIKKMFPELKV